MKKMYAVLMLILISGIVSTFFGTTSFGGDRFKAVTRQAVAANAIRPLDLPDYSSSLVFVPLNPCRIIDTRLAGGKILGGTTRNFVVVGTDFSSQGGYAGSCGVDPDASAIAVTLTATKEDGRGNLIAWPYSGTMLTSSVLNYIASVDVANTTILPICGGAGCDYAFSIYANVWGTHLVTDVTGYFIKRVPAVFTAEDTPGGITIPTSTSSTDVQCQTTSYIPPLNGKAVIDVQMSLSAASTNTFSVRPGYSTDGGTTWNTVGTSGNWVSNPAGGWVTSTASYTVDLTKDTEYTFGVQYNAQGSSFTSTDSTCHIRVVIVDR